MASDQEQVLDHTVKRGKALEMAERLEALHLTFTLASRLMRVLGSVVGVLIHLVHDRRHDAAESHTVAGQLVDNET